MTIKRKKVKKISQRNSCSLESFSGFSIRCWQFSVNLRNKKQPCLSGVLWHRPQPLPSAHHSSSDVSVLCNLFCLQMSFLYYLMIPFQIGCLQCIANYSLSAYSTDTVLSQISSILVKLKQWNYYYSTIWSHFGTIIIGEYT